MKILLVVWSLTQQKGGRERAGSTLANAMDERGHDCVVLTDDHKKRPSLYPLNGGVSLEYMDLFDNSYGRNVLRKKILNIAPDVVMTMCSSREIIDWPVLLKGTGIPLIISERVDPAVTERDCWKSKKERLAVLSAADTIHIQMEGYRSYYPNFLKDRVSVIPNPVTPAERLADPVGANNKRKTIIHVGRISEKQKRQRLMVRAFALIADKFPEWDLDFWGGGALTSGDDLRAQIERSGLTGRAHVRWTTDNIEAKLLSSQVFVFPSEMEGCPNALLEAQAHGLPAIGYRYCGGTNEIILDGENGILFDKLDEPSVAKALEKLLETPLLRQKMGQAAFRNSQKYTPKKIFDAYEAMFLSAVRKKNQTRMDSVPEGAEIQYFEYIEHLCTRENVHKLNGIALRPCLFAMIEDKRKKISRNYFRPLRDWLRSLKGKRVKR